MGKAIYYGGGSQFFDDAGDPLSLGRLYTYQPGTTTPMATYKEAALTNAHTNYIELDAYGRPPGGQIWFSGNTKLLVFNRLGVLVPAIGGDNLNPDPSGLGTYSSKNSAVLTKSAAYTVTLADDGKLIIGTVGGWTLALPSAASVGDGFSFDFLNATDDVITADASGTQTINGQLTQQFYHWGGGKFVCDGSNWRLLRSAADAVIQRGSVGSPSPSSFDFTGFLANVRAYRITFANLRPTSDNVDLLARFYNGGWMTGATDYCWSIITGTDNLMSCLVSEGANSMSLTNVNIDNGSDGQLAGEILILDPMNTSSRTQIIWTFSHRTDASKIAHVSGSAQLTTLDAISGFRIYFSGSVTIQQFDYTVTAVGGLG